MATTEERENRIREAISPGFRDRLLSKGAARAMIWTNGELPENAPNFPRRLSHDLLAYAYALLSDGLHLLEDEGDRETARMAFEHAARAIESVVVRGKTTRARDFHRFVMSAAYHLARYSARAFSLIQNNLAEANLTAFERAVSLLMTRDLDALETLVRGYKEAGSGSDEALISQAVEATADGENPPDLDDMLDITVEALTDSFMTALAEASFALERGDPALIEHAKARLREGMTVASDLHHVPQWWCHRLTLFLIDDLWASSFHANLPFAPNGLDANEWRHFRALFIASLFSRGRAEIDLWPSQLEAAGRSMELDENLVVSLPTSAGKTRIAELCILACLASGKRVVFITPLRALSAQTEVGLEQTFSPLGKSVSSLYGSIGDASIDQDFLRERDIIVATPEKLDFALRNDPDILNDVGLVVLDEGHMIGLTEREIRYEVQIQRLLKRADADQRRIVCLSAILPDGEKLEDFSGWITEDGDDGLVQKDWRPTRLQFGEIVWSGDHARLEFSVGEERPFVPKYLEAVVPPIGRRKKPFPNSQKEFCLATAWKLVEAGQTVLIFCPLRKSVEPFARDIIDLYDRGALAGVLDADPQLLEKAITIGREWYPEDHAVLACLKIGVAIHHGALPTPFRREVERLLRAGILRITISSPTLAQGLNLSATALIFQSLHRNRELLKVSEFRNVVGRAGRAFIDVEGLVLYPMFDKVNKRRRDWERLIADAGGKEMESGLLALVRHLIGRMISKYNLKSADAIIEYVVNNADWSFPVIDKEDEEERASNEQRWDNYMAWLDTALLGLLGDQEIEGEAIESALDAILASSLWERRLARQSDGIAAILKAGLVQRTKTIWGETTAIQRRAYFLSGVGTKTGAALDARAAELNELLLQANGSILLEENVDAIKAFVGFAEIVFDIAPFRPKNLPQDWRDILTAWVSGKPLTDALAETDSESLHFIEDALVYRLAWAMEAVRVRWQASGDTIGDGLTYDDLELGVATSAIETGTLNRSAAIIMKSGFTPRVPAQKLVNDTGASFASLNELRAWLRSEEIQSLGENADWPSAETHDLWTDFIRSFKTADEKEWIGSKGEIDVIWDTENAPAAGTLVRIDPRKEETRILTADYLPLGRLTESISPSYAGGILYGDVAGTKNAITVTYFGPK